MTQIGLVAAMLAVAAGSTAVAPAETDVVGRISACRSIQEPDRRLACFDGAAAALSTAISSHDVTVLDRKEVQKTRRSLFGFALPNLKLLGMGDDDREKAPEFSVLDTKIASFRQVSYQKYDIVTTEGAVWRNSDLLDYPPQIGDAIHLKRGAIGSYLMRVAGGRSVHALRVR